MKTRSSWWKLQFLGVESLIFSVMIIPDPVGCLFRHSRSDRVQINTNEKVNLVTWENISHRYSLHYTIVLCRTKFDFPINLLINTCKINNQYDSSFPRRPPSYLDEELMIQNFHTNHFINLQVKYKDNKIQDARQTIGLLKPKASVGVISFYPESVGIRFLASPHVSFSTCVDLNARWSHQFFMHRDISRFKGPVPDYLDWIHLSK